MNQWLVFALFAVIVLAVAVVMAPLRMRRAQLRRPSLGREGFIVICGREGVERSIAAAVYDGLGRHTAVDLDRLYPGDDLHRTHYVDDDDLTAAIRAIADSCGRVFPPPQDVVDRLAAAYTATTPHYIAELISQSPRGAN